MDLRDITGRASGADGEAPVGYYGLPVIKWPHWDWKIESYLFLGGVASGAYTIGSLATLSNSDDDTPIARTGYIVGAAAGAACLPILVSHLGRPDRFHHMLRVFKPSSPMNAGVWGLSSMAPIALASVLAAMSERASYALPRKALAVAGTPLALFIGAYTGVLLTHTSVPLWATSPLLPAVFACSALSSGVAAVSLWLTLSEKGSHAAHRRLESAERIAAVAETAALAAWLGHLGPAAKPLTEGKHRDMLLFGVIAAGIALPLLLPSGGKRTSWLDVLKPALVLGGALLLRRTVVRAGKDSATDPQATFDMTRRPR